MITLKLGQLACLAALMWELGYLACLSLNIKRRHEGVPLTRWERFALSPLAVAGIAAQTVALSGVVTALILR